MSIPIQWVNMAATNASWLVSYSAANAAQLNTVAYDFQDGTLGGWQSSNGNWTLEIAQEENGNKFLRADYEKTHAWGHLWIPVDPEMIALHRYVTMKVKGRVEFLGKLWSSDDLQQDMEAFTSDSDTEWSTIRFDTKKATIISPDRDPVTRVILFPAPGKWVGRGTFSIDDVEYSNSL